jgi:signal peptidase
MKQVKHRSTDTLLAGAKQAGEWLLLGLAVAVAMAAVVVPRLAGATPYAVLTGSMAPTMPPGTLVVVKPVAPADIEAGDVITFWPREHDPTVMTHRVVSVGFDSAGRPSFVTRGDANAVSDPTPVRAPQVVGERWYSVPYVGYLTDLLSGQQRAFGILLLAGALLAYAIAMFAGALRDRVRRPEVADA